MNDEYRVSDAVVLKSVPKDADENPYGITEVMSLQPGRPSVVMFGGEYTSMPLAANHYIKYMKNLLAENHISDTDVDIFSAYYLWGSRHADTERDQLFRDQGRETHGLGWRTMLYRANKLQAMNMHELMPRYIEVLFDVVVRPLILDKTGVRFDINTALSHVGRVWFYAHSHGAAVVYMLGEYMAKKMRQYKYSDAEIRRIQNAVCVVQHGPTAPLEHTRFKTLSFMSASDTVSNQRNIFYYRLNKYADCVGPMFINRWGMNLFVCGHLWDDKDMEHDDRGMLNADFRRLTPEGKIVIGAERNAILNLIKRTVNGSATTQYAIADLVSGDGIDFQTLLMGGRNFYNNMYGDLHVKYPQNPKHGRQR